MQLILCPKIRTELQWKQANKVLESEKCGCQSLIKKKCKKKFAIRCKYVCERVKKDSLLITENKLNRPSIRKSSYADVAAGQVGESTVLSTVPNNPGYSRFGTVSPGLQIRVWNLQDNLRSLPFLQQTRLTDYKISTILRCLSHFYVHIINGSGMSL